MQVEQQWGIRISLVESVPTNSNQSSTIYASMALVLALETALVCSVGGSPWKP